MKSRYLINVVLIVLIIGLYWFNKQEHLDTEVEKLSNLTATDIQSITITKPNGDIISLAKDPAGWQLSQPFSAIANQTRLELLLSLLNTNSYAQHQLQPDDMLSSFGLDDTSTTITFNDNVFKFGAVEPISRHRYVLSNQTIHLIKDQISPLLNTRAASFIDNRLISANDIIDKLIIPLRTHDNALSDAQTVITKNDGHWQSTVGSLSSDQLTQLVDLWQHAYALQVEPLPFYAISEHVPKNVQIWYHDEEEPVSFHIELNEKTLFIINPQHHLKYQFPTAFAQQLFPTILGAD